MFIWKLNSLKAMEKGWWICELSLLNMWLSYGFDVWRSWRARLDVGGCWMVPWSRLRVSGRLGSVKWALEPPVQGTHRGEMLPHQSVVVDASVVYGSKVYVEGRISILPWTVATRRGGAARSQTSWSTSIILQFN